MADSIFLIQGEDQLVQMESQPYDSEALLQTLLAKFPDLLAGGQIDVESPRQWLLVKREMGVPADEGTSDHWCLDHLLLDQDAIPTLVEVKKSSNTDIRRKVVGQMLDYAANAVVHWPVEQIQAAFKSNNPDPESRLAEFLGDDGDPEEFWQNVKTNLQAGRIRMLFVADVIPPQLRRIIEFLNEQMDPAEVLGVEIKQYVGEGMKTLVPRVIGQTAEADRKKGHEPEWSNWDQALADIPNVALVAYFNKRIEENWESRLPYRELIFRQGGKRHWWVSAKKKNAYVWQGGRFDGDITFWRKGLSQADDVQPVQQGTCLRFYLTSENDFAFFHEAATGSLQSKTWSDGVAAGDDNMGENEEG